jgi:hypothetical protein
MDLLKSAGISSHNLIKQIFYSRVYTDTYENIGDGGPACYKELTVEFRIIIAIIMVIELSSLNEGYILILSLKVFGETNESKIYRVI